MGKVVLEVEKKGTGAMGKLVKKKFEWWRKIGVGTWKLEDRNAGERETIYVAWEQGDSAPIFMAQLLPCLLRLRLRNRQ